jgi:uncharacterized Tic20 family protein
MENLPPEKSSSQGSAVDPTPATSTTSVPPSDHTATTVTTISQDSKNLALLTWIGTIFFGFIPGLVLYLIKKDDAYVLDQAKEALNWAITLLFGYCIAFFLSFIVIGVFLFPLLGIVHVVFCILGVVGAQKGDTFRVPYAVRLIQ